MKELTDNFGEKISLGDALLYAVKESTSVSQHYAFVYGIELHGTSYRLKVVACGQSYDWNQHKYTPSFYKTTLTAKNFTKVPMSAVHESVREELLKRLP